MIVKELKELLETMPDDVVVILQSDSEGNSYSPMSGGCIVMYVAESSYSGTAYEEEEYYNEIKEEYVEPDSGVKALCLWPLN